MVDIPNLDYEPGPQAASYSRVGPPPVRPGRAAGQETANAVADLAFEVAGELETQGARATQRRRTSRRRYRFR